MSSSLSTCFSGRIRNWVNTATDIKSITTLHMLWKSKEFIRQLLMASGLNFIWKTFLDCDWAQKFKTIWVREGSVQFSRSVMSDSATPWTSAYQIPLSITNSRSSLKLTSLSWWCHPTISSSVIPSFSTFNLSQDQGLFQWVSFSHQVAKVLEFHLQYESFQWTPRTDFLYDGLVGSPCSPRDSQESSLTPQFKSINSLALSFLYSPNLTSINDYWKNHSLDETDLCWQNNVSAI